jgi:AraC-like DNA-binding protein
MQKLFLAGLSEEARAARYSARGLARRQGIGIRQFERLFHQYTGTTPQHWLNWLRLQDAVPMLAQGRSVKEVAQALGFRQASHFSRQFTQHFGISPKQAQQTHRTGDLSLLDTKMSLVDMPSPCSSAGVGCAIAVLDAKSSELTVSGRSWTLVNEGSSLYIMRFL